MRIEKNHKEVSYFFYVCPPGKLAVCYKVRWRQLYQSRTFVVHILKGGMDIDDPFEIVSDDHLEKYTAPSYYHSASLLKEYFNRLFKY